MPGKGKKRNSRKKVKIESTSVTVQEDEISVVQLTLEERFEDIKNRVKKAENEMKKLRMNSMTTTPDEAHEARVNELKGQLKGYGLELREVMHELNKQQSTDTSNRMPDEQRQKRQRMMELKKIADSLRTANEE